MIAATYTRCPCCGTDWRTTCTSNATESVACLCRFDQKTAEDWAAISMELALCTQELLSKGKREWLFARRMIRAAGRRDSRKGWRRFRMPHVKSMEVRTPEHPYQLRLMECNRWE